MLHAHVRATSPFSQEAEHQGREVVTPSKSRCNLSRWGFSFALGALTVHSCRQHSVQMGLCQSWESIPGLARPPSFQPWSHPRQEELILTTRVLALVGLFTRTKLSWIRPGLSTSETASSHGREGRAGAQQTLDDVSASSCLASPRAHFGELAQLADISVSHYH